MKIYKYTFTAVILLILSFNISNTLKAEELSGKIVMWTWTTVALEEAAKDFMKEHPNTTVEIQKVGHSAVNQKLKIGLISKGSGLPDASLMQDIYFSNYVKQYPSQYLNLTDLGLDERYKQLFPNYKLSMISINNSLYGFPWDGGPAVVFYRRAIFKKAGVDPNSIKTWDDYFKAAEVIYKKTKKHVLSEVEAGGIYSTIMAQSGSGYIDKNGNIDILRPRSIAAVKKIREAFKKKLIFRRSQNPESYVRYVNRSDIVAQPEGIWLANILASEVPKTAGDWGIFPLPIWKEGDGRSTTSGGSSFVIFKNSKNPKLAYEFFKYFTTSDKYQTLSFQKGLFPTLKTIHTTEEFNKGVPFYGGQAIWKIGASVVDEIKPIDFNTDYYIVSTELGKAVNALITNNDDIKERLMQVAKSLQIHTGRKINTYE